MPYHAADCWCETCRRFRARLEALAAELKEFRAEEAEYALDVAACIPEKLDKVRRERDDARARLEALEAELAEARQTIAVLQEALGIDTSPPTEAELAYARQLAETGR